jgi:sugar phosphate isomerase/epimerase
MPRIVIALILFCASVSGFAAEYQLFARTNLVAWCIVPFDAKKRTPEERAAMLDRIGIRRLAYDYRAEHVPTFDAEIAALRRHNIELLAWWFPQQMSGEARHILNVLRRNKVKTQLWVMGSGETPRNEEQHAQRIDKEVLRLRPLAEMAAAMGCSVALYNHGGWFGEPTNQIEILKHLKARNVGIVYNLHHAHDQIDRFPELLRKMKPHLYAINLNGMIENGDKVGKKIVPLGQGTRDLEILKAIRDSGWRGPIGILNHTDEDAEARLLDNLEGLDWLVAQLDGAPAKAKPTPRTWRP